VGQAQRIRMLAWFASFFRVPPFLWGLRVNAAVFAFIIYFFRLLFELPALILDQSNNFYWFQILTLFYMCPCVYVCVCKENAANPYIGAVVTTKYGKIFYDDAIVVSGERRKRRYGRW